MTESTESRVELPATVDGDFEVYVNGIHQQYAVDYEVDGRTLVFRRRLEPEVKMSKFQFVRAALGIAGTYGKHDSVDVVYEHGGRKLVATGLVPRSIDDPD